jgi:hypothetical protein
MFALVHNRPQPFFFLISVAMQRERDELVDAPYRRDFLTYDNHLLDGEMFLQASTFRHQEDTKRWLKILQYHGHPGGGDGEQQGHIYLVFLKSVILAIF